MKNRLIYWHLYYWLILKQIELDPTSLFSTRLWNDELSKAKRCKRKPNLFWPIMRQYGLLCCVLSAVSICAVGRSLSVDT